MTPEWLAKCTLVVAAVGGMPDTFWSTDSRIRSACNALGWTADEAREWANANMDYIPPLQSDNPLPQADTERRPYMYADDDDDLADDDERYDPHGDTA